MRKYHKVLDIVLLTLVVIFYFHLGFLEEGFSIGVLFKYLFGLVLSIFFIVGIILAYIIAILVKYGGVIAPFVTFPIWITTGLSELLVIIICIWFVFSVINAYTAYKCKYYFYGF